MRLHRLTATAFGPFADSVDLDLESLSAAGLFLVHGPTGSGKTSLLDAICFALYAGVPGDRQPTTLRSHHASPTQPTSVTLELTLADRRLRVTRRPAHERPKKRGTGTTTEPARVQLDERVDGGWTSLSSRIDETAHLLDDLLGMALDQFRRVVMLPPGDFAAFLRAEDEERREVLERLFDVADYVDVERHLVERRQEVQGALSGLRSALDGHTLRLEELLAESDTELPVSEAPLHELTVERLLATVRRVDDALGARAAEVMTLVDLTRQRHGSARAALDAGRRTAELRRRGARARADLEVLDESRDDHAARRRRLAGAREAAALLPHVEAVDRARRHAATAEADHGQAVRDLPQELRDRDLAGLRGGLAQQEELLGGARHEADALIRLRTRTPDTAGTVEVRRAAVADAESVRASTRTRAEELRSARQEVAAAQDRLAVVTPLLVRVMDLATARSEVVELRDGARGTTDARQTAQQHALDRREEVHRLVEERLDGMAGELAGRLVDGAACSVCGALEHPAPAPATGQVTPERIERARAAAAVAEAGHEEARVADEEALSRLEVARARVTEIEAQLTTEAATFAAEIADVDDLDEHVVRLRDERDALQAVTARLPEVDRALEAAEGEIGRAEAACGEAATALAEARARHERQAEELAAGTARLAEALTAHTDRCPCGGVRDDTADAGDPAWGPPTVEALLDDSVQHHRAVLERTERVLAAATALDGARTAHGEATERLATALTESAFDDVDAVTAAALDRDGLAELEHRVDDHERRRAAAESVLAEEEVTHALASDPPDLAALTAEVGRTHDAADEAARRQATVQTVVRQFTVVRDHIERTCTELGPAIEEADLVTRMSALVTGTSQDNDKRMRLSTYVLAARLERIVELANERLLDMADGRYELGHHDGAGRGRRRGGLGLLVRDLWTGRERPTDTLSGGESFTVSLALALGLADGIREESGGHEFGTLFVDEGFGSLDEDSLEQVLDMLDRLRDGGRAVGVVSHVSEMRTRIPTQIRVDKTSSGSSVQVLEGTATVA